MKRINPAYALMTLIGMCVVSITLCTVCWFGPARTGTGENDAIDGQIGLRSYFYDGNGSEENPYEIVTSTHLYNLSRLQNLGIFDSQKYYFQLGHNFSDDPMNPDYRCINYNSSNEQTRDKYLDMQRFCEVSRVVAIGGEGAPFRGTFNGKGLSIRNLTITGNPEDIGFFGYIASDGKATDFTLENVTIKSIGYSETSPFTELFGSDVDDIFNEQGNNASFSRADLRFKDGANDEVTLHNTQGIGGRGYAAINSSTKTVTVGDTIYYDGFFTPTYPNDDTFEYSWRFSTNVLEKYTDENGVERGRINLSLLKNSAEFNSGANAQIDSRIYLIANKTIKGYTYSRVMQSYVCEFFSNGCNSYDEGTYSMSIFMDHKEGEGSTYHHGNNIGYLAGHVDGIMKDCYVYNGTFNVNNTADQVHIDTESQTGLVGEIGINVENSIDPGIGLTTKGDTGIMNFSGIYKMIRNDAVVGTSLWSNFGYDSSGNRISFFAYNNLLNEGYVNYKDYLRTDDSSSESTRHYISKYNAKDLVQDNGVTISATSGELKYINTVDFKHNQVIQDTDEVDRGLGVFRLATSDGGTNPTYLDQIGNCQIINGAEKTKVYYSTAEYDHTRFGTKGWNHSFSTTNPDYTKYYFCEMMDTMPTYGDTRTWDPILERDLNFYIEMDLTQASTTAGNNFFYNTDSPFLTEYLRYKLIDKEGEKLNPGEKRFGFMFRDSQGVVIDKLSSYMPVKKPSAKFSYRETDGNYKYYPSNTITFRIDNPNGANVSVVAASTNHTTIFSYNPDSSSTADIKPLYSMFTTPTSTQDTAPYFKYDATDGTTTTIAELPTKDKLARTDKLFGHIFKLPQGDYCIGCDTAGDGKYSSIYMLAVQGQNDSNIGDIEVPSLGAAEVDVDFLIYDPDTEKKKAKFSFRISLNSNPGLFVVTGTAGYISITFVVEDAYVDSLTTYDRNSSIHYQVNGVDQSVSNYKYTR